MIVKRKYKVTKDPATDNGFTITGSIGIAKGDKGDKGDKGESGDIQAGEILEDLQNQINNNKNFETVWGDTSEFSNVTAITGTPTELRCGSGATVGNCIYYSMGSLGGFDAPDGTMWQYNMTTGVWTQKRTIKAGRERYWGKCVAIGTKIYYAGGCITYASSTPQPVFFDCYDTVTNTWTALADMPVGKVRFAMCEANGKIYVQGGRGHYDAHSYEFMEYDPATDTWNKDFAKGYFPDADHNMWYYNGDFYVTAAFNAIVYKANLTAGVAWEMYSSAIGYTRGNSNTVRIGDVIYFMGKHHDPNNHTEHTGSIMAYDMANDIWSFSEMAIERDSLYFDLFELPCVGYDESTKLFYLFNVSGAYGFTGHKFGFKTTNVTVSQTMDTETNLLRYVGVAGQIAVSEKDGAIFSYDGKTVGGHKIGGAVDYEPKLGKVKEDGWVLLPDYPLVTVSSMAVVKNGDIYSFGGEVSSGGAEAINDNSLYMFNPQYGHRTWEKKAPMPVKLSDASYLDSPTSSALFVWGGKSYTNNINNTNNEVENTTMYWYNYEQDSWGVKGQFPADVHQGDATAVIFDGYIYNFGLGSGNNFTKVYRFNLSGDTWEFYDTLPSKMTSSAYNPQGMFSFVYKDEIYLGGGYSGCYSKIVKYDPVEKTYTDVCSLPADRYDDVYSDFRFYTAMVTSSAYTNSDKVYFMGGQADGNYGYLFCLDMKTLTWETIPEFDGVSRHASSAYCMYKNEIYSVGGQDPSGRYSNTFCKYIPEKSFSHTKLSLAIAEEGILAGGYKGNLGELIVDVKRSSSSTTTSINVTGVDLYLMDGKTMGGKLIGDMTDYYNKKEVEKIARDTSKQAVIDGTYVPPMRVDGYLNFDGTTFTLEEFSTEIQGIAWDAATFILTINHSKVGGCNITAVPVGSKVNFIVKELNPVNTKLEFLDALDVPATPTVAFKIAFTRTSTGVIPIKATTEYVQPTIVTTGGVITYKKFTENTDCEFTLAGGMGGNATGYEVAGKDWAKGRPADTVKFKHSFKKDDEILILAGCSAINNGTLPTSTSDGHSGAGGGASTIALIRRDITGMATDEQMGQGIATIMALTNFPTEANLVAEETMVELIGLACGGSGGRDGKYGNTNDIVGNSTELFKPVSKDDWLIIGTATSGGFIYYSTGKYKGLSFVRGGDGSPTYYTRNGTCMAGFGSGGGNSDDSAGGSGGTPRPSASGKAEILGRASYINKHSELIELLPNSNMATGKIIIVER